MGQTFACAFICSSNASVPEAFEKRRNVCSVLMVLSEVCVIGLFSADCL